MIYNLTKKLKNYVLAASLFLATAFFSLKSYANDIFVGMRGPTNFQIDERISWSKNNKNIETIINSLILKYWDGDKSGKCIFVSIPYKFVNSPKGSNNGLGDISVGFGPRGRFDNLHWFFYPSVIIPTGNSKDKVPLGNGRYDIKFTYLSTYLRDDKKFEIDGLLGYTITGKNKKDINPPNELSAGLLAGGKIMNNTRFAAGLTYLINGSNDYLLNSRSVVRYTASSSLHFEFIADIGLKSKIIAKGNEMALFTRYNF